MKFGLYPIDQCKGAILAHSLYLDSKKIPKGTVLNANQLEQIKSTGLSELTVAILEPNDIGEDASAEWIGNRIQELEPKFFTSAPFTGRVNLFAKEPGIIAIDPERIQQFNLVDPAITLATVGHLVRASKHQLIGTIKVIQYGVDRNKVEECLNYLEGTLGFRSVTLKSADLILTVQNPSDEKLANKGVIATQSRLEALGITLNSVTFTKHRIGDLSQQIKNCTAPIILILTASATSDRKDTGPMALVQAGGNLIQVGIPVDPGNLLFYGKLGTKEVIGLPGCARSPALNGADWVLERISCGLKLERKDFALMGAGGLLKEIPTRRQPRNSIKKPPSKPEVYCIVLVDNDSNSIDEHINPIIQSLSDGIIIVGENDTTIEVIGEKSEKISIVNLPIESSKNSQIKSGLGALPTDADAVIFINTNLPPVPTKIINRLMSGFSPDDNREIGLWVGSAHPEKPPILFGRRFFENLGNLSQGLKPVDLIQDAREFLYEIQ